MNRFPSMGMKRLLAKHPKAERCVQIRIFNRAGDVVTVEGACTDEAAKEIFKHAVGPMLFTKSGDAAFDAAFATTGCQYGEDALENVRTGWDLRERVFQSPMYEPTFEEAWEKTGYHYGPIPLAQALLGWDLHAKHGKKK